jgi:hypothetical protein
LMILIVKNNLLTKIQKKSRTWADSLDNMLLVLSLFVLIAMSF